MICLECKPDLSETVLALDSLSSLSCSPHFYHQKGGDTHHDLNGGNGEKHLEQSGAAHVAPGVKEDVGYSVDRFYDGRWPFG